MIVTAWNNGAHSRNGSGYGFKVSVADRDHLLNFSKSYILQTAQYHRGN